MTRRAPLALAAALAAAGLSGCGTQTLVAGLLVGLPQINYQPPQTCQGTVCVTPEAQTFGPFTVLTGAVFTIETSDPTKIQDSKVTGVSGVNASLNYRSCLTLTGAALTDCLAGSGGIDRVFKVTDQGSGLYALTNNDSGASAFSFESGVRYTMVLEVPQGDTATSGATSTASGEWEAYGAGFKPGPAAQMTNFVDQKDSTKRVALQSAIGTPMTITRSDAKVNGEYLPAFVLVGQIADPSTASGRSTVPTITYTSLDYKDPKKLALLALSDQPYRKGTFDVPGSAFPSAGYYVVALLSVTEGKASANAFIGSTALAASGDAGLVITK
jgi:hypothetical protein